MGEGFLKDHMVFRVMVALRKLFVGYFCIHFRIDDLFV